MLSTTTAIEPKASVAPARDEAPWDTTLARCLATILIANSHLEAFYPWSWLAADGQVGNTMFYLASGLGLAMRNRAADLSFLGWYLRRVLRIYPSVWVCLIPLSVVATGAWREWTPLDYVHDLVWPTDYGFIRDIMVYYALGYVLLRRWRSAPGWVLLAITALAVATGLHAASAMPEGRLSIGSLPEPFWRAWWLLMFLLGMALPRLRLAETVSKGIGWWVAGSCLLYVVLKYAMVVAGIAPRAFLLLFAVGTAVGTSMTIAGAKSDRVQAWLTGGRLGSVVRWLGGMSLEVYLIHAFLAHSPKVAAIGFPLNLVVFAVGTLVLSHVANRLATAIRQRLTPA